MGSSQTSVSDSRSHLSKLLWVMLTLKTHWELCTSYSLCSPIPTELRSHSISTLSSFPLSDKWKHYPICFPAPPSANKTKVLLAVLRSLHVMECHYHSGFTALISFCFLASGCSSPKRPKITVIPQGYHALLIWSHRKILYYYVISQTLHPWSNYKKNQTQTEDSL